MDQAVIEGFRLSPQQRRLWQLGREQAGAAQAVLRLDGDVDGSALRRTLQATVARHEILRTTFSTLPGMDLPLQVIGHEPRFDFREIAPHAGSLARVLAEERAVPFDLQNGPLVRFALLPAGPQERLLIVTASPTAADDRSLCNLFVEIAEGYGGAESEGIQYADFSEWQNEMLEEEAARARRDSWRLRGAAGARGWRLPAAGDAEGLSVLRLEGTLVERAEALAVHRCLPLRSVLLACWCLLLRRLLPERDLKEVGCLANGRRFEQLEQGIGLFARYLPLQLPLEPDLSFVELLTAVHGELEEAERNQEYFLWEDYAPEQQLGCLPILFDFAETPGAREAGGVRFMLAERHVTLEPSDLRLAVFRDTEGLRAELAWRSSLAGEHGDLWLARFETLLRSALEEPERPVVELQAVGEEERQRLDLWSRGESGDVSALPLHVLFEQQAGRSPGAVALAWEGGSIRYDELDHRANRLARHLQRRGLRPGGLLGLILERSPEQVVALLAAWKAGAAFSPLDPAQPQQRLRDMIAELADHPRGAVLLSQSALCERAGGVRLPLVDLDAEADAIASEAATPLSVAGGPEWPAYVIFTSGSTGRPKGVMVRHGSAMNLAAALAHAVYSPDNAAPLRVSVNAPLSFDASIKQIVQLLSGHSLHLVPEEMRRDGEAFVGFLRRHAVDVLDCTPSQLRLLLEAGLMSGARPRLALVGGEAIDRDLWSALARDQGAAWFNVYGPTECTVDATAERVAAGAPNLGRPLPNVEVHLLDSGLNRVPAGVVGEICIGGAGVAMGYVSHPAQTAERFIPHPFAAAPGERLYRSGDLGRHLADGRIEFLGRRDHQVKLRGFRVELGEIEAALAEHPGVREAAVTLRHDLRGGPGIVAFVVAGGAPAAAGERHVLPNGMPAYLLDRTESIYVYREIFEDGCYLRHGIRLPADAVVFDVGANVGLFTLFARQHAPRARIYAFEPIPAVFDVLRANAVLYGAEAKLFPHGLSDREGRESFTFYPRYSARSGLTAYADARSEMQVIRRYMENAWGAGDGQPAAEMEEVLEGRFAGELVEVPMRRLSEVVREEGIDRIDLLKVDVQRAEMDVLRGIDAETWERIQQVVMEVHDEPGGSTEGRLEQVRALLERQGFEVFAEQDEALRGTDRHNVHASRHGLSIGERPALAPAPLSPLPGLDGQASAAALRAFLAERVPEPFLPSQIVFMETLPYNRSGKVDRLALPPPEEEADSGRPLEAPRTQVEEVLTALFADVLGTGRVGADQSFFHLGGHSLLATQLAARVRKAFRIELPLRTIFEAPTVRELAFHVEAGMQAGRGAAPPIEPVPRNGDLPLSSSQQSLWFLQQWNPASASYNSARVLHVQGRLDLAVVESVFTEIVRRHEILRTIFPSVGGEPRQKIEPPSPVCLSPMDLGHLRQEERASEARRLALEGAQRPFDLAAEPPLRLAVFRLADDEHVLAMTLHHIACDAWSMAVLQREVAALFAAFSEGRPSPLAEPGLQYADYAVWHRRWMRGRVLEEHLAWWKSQLAGAPPELDLPRDAAPAVKGAGAVTRSFLLPSGLAAGLEDLGHRTGTTLYMTLLAAFGVLLSRSCGQEDLVVGCAVAGRDRVDTEGLIGLFINMLPMRLDLTGAPGFTDLLASVREMTLGAYMHQGLPFERLVEELPQARSLGRNPVFQVAFGVQNVPSDPFELSGLTFTPWEVHHESRLELTLWISQSTDGLRAIWTYDPALFRPEMVDLWQARFARLLESILAQPEASVQDLELLSADEQQEAELRKRQRESANLFRLRGIQRKSIGQA